jgi:ADP-dependent NAD(P)H-hydrate dehydratase / NAD(P)H-hydrate epimerase
MRFHPVAHPILTPAEAKTFEQRLFNGDETAEWKAMQAAGRAVGREVMADFPQRVEWPARPRILVLIGKGHNGGDALLAAQALLARFEHASADLLFFAPEKDLRPLTTRAYREFTYTAGERARPVTLAEVEKQSYDVWLDGVFGFQFHAPLEDRTAAMFERLEKIEVGLRAAVDLPSGLGDARALRADFTYATGSLKSLVLAPENQAKAGRVRYLDLRFFAKPSGGHDATLLCRETLDTLRRWRDPHGDKRAYGHLFVIGGSRSFPGAVMMATKAALESGIGLLTAFVPESLVPAYAAQLPEAMWVGCPETEAGGIALEGLHLVRERAKRATALVIGPGMAREPETLAFIKEVLKEIDLPAVIDADALQPDIVTKGAKPRIVTPHAGEFKRLAGEKSAEDYARETGVITVLKGVPTRITDGHTSYLSIAGGPVLARGGSGDMLSGMTGTLLAQDPENPLGAAATAVFWHGSAAEAWARTCGETAVRSTQLLDFLPNVIRSPRVS